MESSEKTKFNVSHFINFCFLLYHIVGTYSDFKFYRATAISIPLPHNHIKKIIIDEHIHTEIQRTLNRLLYVVLMFPSNPPNKWLWSSQNWSPPQVKCIDEEKGSIPQLNFDKKETRWRLGQLLLFLDCYDTPRIPLRLFQRLCQVQ